MSFKKEINATLVFENNQYFISFDLSENKKLNLSTDNPDEIKEFFTFLLNDFSNENFDIVYNETEDLKLSLFNEVAKLYIEDLKKELNDIFTDPDFQKYH